MEFNDHTEVKQTLVVTIYHMAEACSRPSREVLYTYPQPETVVTSSVTCGGSSGVTRGKTKSLIKNWGFWLGIAGVIVFVAGIIGYEVAHGKDPTKKIGWWVWLLLALGAVMAIGGFIWLAISLKK